MLTRHLVFRVPIEGQSKKQIVQRFKNCALTVLAGEHSTDDRVGVHRREGAGHREGVRVRPSAAAGSSGRSGGRRDHQVGCHKVQPVKECFIFG